MKLKRVMALTTSLLILVSPAAATVYDVNLAFPNADQKGTVYLTGQITTDGTLGPLGPTNLYAFFSLTDGFTGGGVSTDGFGIPNVYPYLIMQGPALFATSSGVFYNFDIANSQFTVNGYDPIDVAGVSFQTGLLNLFALTTRVIQTLVHQSRKQEF